MVSGVADPYFRRMDVYARLGMTAIALALKDASLDRWTHKRSIGLIASTVYGCLQTDADYYDTVLSSEGLAPSPALFANTLASSLIGEAAIRFGLAGAGFVIAEPAGSTAMGLAGLQAALSMMHDGAASRMLCGFCDAGPPAFLNLGENAVRGALFLVLERGPRGKQPAYGIVRRGDRGRHVFGAAAVKDLFQLARLVLKQA